MLVAFWLQVLWNSPPRCSNAGFSGLPISASRISHSIWSKGCTPGVEKRRSTESPRRPFLGILVAVLDIELLLSRVLFRGCREWPVLRTERRCVSANREGESAAAPCSHCLKSASSALLPGTLL